MQALFDTLKNYVARIRKLAHPPLKEAIIDIQFVEQMPEEFAERLRSMAVPGYTQKGPIRFQAVEFAIDVARTSTKNELFGWRFESEDGSRILQFRRNGMGFSIVRGYDDWNQIKSLAKNFWSSFLEWAGTHFQPLVNRLATRYINVIDVPILNLKFDDYLTAPPRIPDSLPQALQRFLQRFEVPFSTEVLAVIIQTSDVPTSTHLPLLLDIDVQLRRQIRSDSPDLWSALDTLRKVKNEIFFSSVTELALDSYQ